MKVYHIELKNEPEETRHHYFGSKISIYAKFSEETIGIAYTTLRCRDLSKKAYENSKCIIRQGTLIRKESQRGKRGRG